MARVRKKGILYICVIVLLLSSCGLLVWVNAYFADIYFYLAFFLAFMLGILHISWGHTSLGIVNILNFGKGLFLLFLILLLSGLIMAVVYYLVKLPFYFIGFEIAFAIPFFIWQAHRQFLQIPNRYYKQWFYPVDERMPDLDMIDLSEIVVVQFVFNKTMEDGKQTNFTSKAPLNMSLGQLFFIFINDYNERNSQQTISYLESENQPFGWFFYKERGWFKRKHYFDPDLSFKENGIIQNGIIYAVRQINPGQI